MRIRLVIDNVWVREMAEDAGLDYEVALKRAEEAEEQIEDEIRQEAADLLRIAIKGRLS